VALVTLLHMSVLAGRVSGRRLPEGQTVATWRMPPNGAAAARGETDKAPSHPVHAFSAGQLALNLGMAVITLAAWLHIVHRKGTLGQ
jgi:hypothetical protein